MLAFPELGLVPCGTPEHTLTTDLPPGVGPYMITDIVPNKSFSVVKNPKFAAATTSRTSRWATSTRST